MLWFPSSLTKKYLKHLDSLSSSFSACHSFDQYFRKPFINAILHDKGFKETIENRDCSIDNFLIFNIGNRALELIISGRFHIYRGSLSMVGEDFLRIYLVSIELLHKDGHWSDDVYNQAITDVKAEIKNPG